MSKVNIEKISFEIINSLELDLRNIDRVIDMVDQKSSECLILIGMKINIEKSKDNASQIWNHMLWDND